MLAENTEENNICLDNDYEQSENILNEIQSFQNIGGDTSIFTGKYILQEHKFQFMFRKIKKLFTYSLQYSTSRIISLNYK